MALADEIKERIRQDGPLRFDRYMEACLAAYYGRGPDIGASTGDFSTSVKFSAFRDAIARLVVLAGAERVVELGAGTGDLAQHVRGRVPDVEYVTVDASAALRERQRAVGARAVGSMRELEAGPRTLVFGNEVLDALPVRRIVGGPRVGDLLEVHVDLDARGTFRDRLLPCDDVEVAQRLREEEVSLSRGQIADLQMGLASFVAEAARLCAPGHLVLIDYGDPAPALFAPQRINGTLAAYRRHQKNADWYANVGEQDLTADVDWTAVGLAAERAGLETLGLVTQRAFLRALGVDEREEVVDGTRLGTAFQVYAARSPGMPPLPGFEPA